MLQIALTALVIAVIAAFLGFGGISSAATGVAMTIFYIAVIVLVASAVLGSLACAASRVV